jgi:REP element-mobilizing transposase RayT
MEDKMPDYQLRIGRYSQAHRAYFVTTNLNERKRYFSDFYCARLVVKEMRILHEAGDVNSLAWVIMPDHLHWLFQLTEQKTLSEVMKYFKARSAHKVNHYLQRQGTLWQTTFYDHGLRQSEDVKAIARYIVANPLRAKLVENIGDYPHWDAIWL